MSVEPFESEDDAETGDALDDAAARLLRSAWKSSPGLLASLAFHGVILAILPIIVFQDKIRELAGIPITIGVTAKRVDPDRPYKPVSGGPPSATGEGLEEKPVFDPIAAAAERNESKARRDQEDRSTMDGESRALLTHFASNVEAGGFGGRLGKGPPGTNFVMGAGGGSGTGGARFGSGPNVAGRQNLATRGGGSKHTEAAVELGLSFLARHQSANGSWTAKTYPCRDCQPDGSHAGDVAATSLAVLAFLTAGYGPESTVVIRDRATGRALVYGNTVRAGLAFLRARQEKSKRRGITSEETHGYAGMYEHAFATMTLCEAYRVSPSPDSKSRATMALDYLVQWQQGDGRWQDTSVTGAFVQALRSARNAGLAVPEKTLDGVRRWFEKVGSPDGGTGYSSKGDREDSMTAIGLYARRFLDPGQTAQDRFMPLAAKKTVESVGDANFTQCTYLWYYVMLALFDYEGPTGKNFKAANKTITTALIAQQHRLQDCKQGSFAGAGGWMPGYGRNLNTAMSVLTLETYYRYIEAEKPVEKPTEKPIQPTLQSAPR